MRLPDFLIVGAAKSGSTSLYRDLLRNPAIVFPAGKEPEGLAFDRVLTPEGLAAYAAPFARARPAPEQFAGDASQCYTVRPNIDGCAERALRVLGPDRRIIYIVRNPIERALSHHYHDVRDGSVGPDPDTELPAHPKFVNGGRYAYQIEPWLDAYGPDNVRIIRFEDFTRDRAAVVAEISSFIGAAPLPPARPVATGEIHNRGERQRLPRGPGMILSGSLVYRRMLRPLVPQPLRAAGRSAALPTAPPRPPVPSRDTLDWLRGRLAPDAERLAVILGATEPLWDLDATVERLSASPAAAAPRPRASA